MYLILFLKSPMQMKNKKIWFIFICFMLFNTDYSTGQIHAYNSIELGETGNYVLGCNYWASHAGTNMWNDWRPEVVDADLEQISKSGMSVIRVFLLWPDFQPIYQFYSSNGTRQEVRFKNEALPKNGPGCDGVNIEALTHFGQLADMANKHQIKLIVGLITGAMSGRLFVPQALEGRKILSDPVSLMWQVKLVRRIVHEFKDHTAILAWDLGNECNVMEDVVGYEAAYTWTATVSNAIRAEDSTRPIVSGMHSLTSDTKAKWRIQDQAELTDIITTHPYLFWTPHTNQDPANTIRSIMHSAAETRFYGDIGGKPCLVEETGIMGPMEANEKTKTDFLRSILFNNWANDCQGLLWWCAYDQDILDFPPYEWIAVERELGLFKSDRSPKPVVDELKKFKTFLNCLPFKSLPQRRKEAVCILTDGQDQWGVAYSSFILAKQAGFDLEFQHSNQLLKDAPLYIMPSIKGQTPINKTDWLTILEKVKDGATLYVSFDTGFLSPFPELAGIEVVSSQNRIEQSSFISTDEPIKPFSFHAVRKLNIMPATATVLAHENEGNPIFTVNSYGKGKIYFLGFPMELNVTQSGESFAEHSPEYWKIYQTIGTEIIKQSRVVAKNDPFVGITEHEISPDKRVIIIVNYSPFDKIVTLSISNGWNPEKSFYGKLPVKSIASIKANDALVFQIGKADIP